MFLKCQNCKNEQISGCQELGMVEERVRSLQGWNSLCVKCGGGDMSLYV